MKRLFSLLMAASVVLGTVCFSWTQSAAAAMGDVSSLAVLAEAAPRNVVDDKMATDYGKKIDVNNTNIAAFRLYRGMYPTIAGKIVRNAPYNEIEDIFNIPGLSDTEIQRMKDNIDIFSISAPNPALVEGDDRYNNGVYK